ncbi:hypothetical protein ABZ847_07795 [Streptomyces bauhiniae]
MRRALGAAAAGALAWLAMSGAHAGIDTGPIAPVTGTAPRYAVQDFN